MATIRGKIKGPGTGTSDSIKTEVPSGTYIMPADSTAKIGEKTLGELGKPVPVNLSNGEYGMSPRQVHAVGAKVLNKMKGATHTPVATQAPRQQDGELYSSDGGLIDGAAQYWAADNAQFEAENPSFGRRVVRALNPATAFGSAMGAMHTASGNGDKTGMALAAAQAVPVFGAMRSVVTPAMGAVKAARAMAPNAAKTGVAIAGSGAAGAMADTYGTPAAGGDPQRPDLAFSDMRREPNIPRPDVLRRSFADGGLVEDERQRVSARASGLGSYAPAQLGQPEPNPNAGSAWRGLKDAFLYSSDAAAIRQRNAPQPAQPATPAAQPQQSTGLVRSVLNAPIAAPDTSIPEVGPRRSLVRDAFGPAIQNQGQTSGDRLADMGYAPRSVQGAPGVTRMNGNGRTIYTNDQSSAADWIEAGMRPGVSVVGGGQEAIERMARANAIRGEYLDSFGGPKAGAIGDGDRSMWSREIDRFSMVGKVGGRAGRAQAAIDQRAQEAELANSRDLAEMSLRERMDGRRAEADAARLAQDAELSRQRIGLEREDLSLRSQTAGLASEVTRRDLADRDRISALRDQYQGEKDPAKREQLGRTLLTLQGKEPSDQAGRWMLADLETGAMDGLGNPVVRKVPVNPVTGQVFQPSAAQGGTVSGSGRSAPTYEQFVAQIRARNQGAQIDEKTLSEAYMRQFGQ